MDRTERLGVFLKVAELLSFSRAAEHLGLPRATVSSAIQELEEQLDARLLHRTTRKVRLTTEGEAFVERAEQVTADVDRLMGMFRVERAQLHGRLRIDLAIGIARDLVVPNLPSFLADHPGITVELSSTDRRVDLIREGFDCVVRAGPVADPNLVFRTIGAYEMVNCASADYVARRGRPTRLADLERHLLVDYVNVFGQAAPEFEYVAEGKLVTRPMRTSVTVNAVDTYLAAALHGLGIVQIPEISARPHLERGALVELLPKHRPPPMPVSLVFPNRRHVPERVRIFAGWLESLIAPRLTRSARASGAAAAPRPTRSRTSPSKRRPRRG